MDPDDLARTRTDYPATVLTEESAGTDPVALFANWMHEAIAAQVSEPNAMALATASQSGIPSVRIVLLKDLNNDGAVFYSNYRSRKGAELEATPHAAAVMLWHSMRRQVRIEGPVAPVSDAESDAYFSQRPRGAQLSAAVSPQSAVIAGRADLERRVRETDEVNAGRSISRPEHWGGYRMGLDIIEFWQGGADRLHDRIRYRRSEAAWSRERLAP